MTLIYDFISESIFQVEISFWIFRLFLRHCFKDTRTWYWNVQTKEIVRIIGNISLRWTGIGDVVAYFITKNLLRICFFYANISFYL